MEREQRDQFVTADLIIDEFLGDTYDDGGILKEKAYRWLFRVWKQIVQDFISCTVRSVLPVNMLTKSIPYPPDMADYISIGYIDCGNVRLLNINPNLAPVTVGDYRKCTRCGQVDLCELSYETINENVTILINNVANHKTKTTTRRIKSDGTYYETVTTPVLVIDPQGVAKIENQTEVRTVCNLEKSACGCYTATHANISTLLQNGCCHELICCNQKNTPINFNSSCMGTVNVFPDERFIQLSPDSPLSSIYLVYKSNALTRNGIFYFPDYAEEALIAGVYFRSIEKKKNISESKVEAARRAYNRQLTHMHRRLSRQTMQELINIFEQVPRFSR